MGSGINVLIGRGGRERETEREKRGTISPSHRVESTEKLSLCDNIALSQ